MALDALYENNRKWVASKQASDPTYFERLSADQKPDYLYIGCSDSRVPANEIFGLHPGDIFVHRNVGNLVNNIDLNVESAITYAVEHLKVKHILVCGHYSCGAVKAAMQPRDLGILNPWLRSIRDIYRLHRTELDGLEDENLRYDRFVEINVYEQCVSVIKTATVQKHLIKSGYPQVHGMVFNLSTGLLKDLEINMPAILEDVQKIYNLEYD
ncbi:MAG: carbonic anhydrase [Armatimonadota bacterium]